MLRYSNPKCEKTLGVWSPLPKGKWDLGTKPRIYNNLTTYQDYG